MILTSDVDRVQVNANGRKSHLNTKKNIQIYLKETGLTAAALARQIGVPKATLSSWLAGTRPSNVLHLKAVADAMNVSVDTLIFGDVNAPDRLSANSPSDWLTVGENGEFSGVFEIRLKPLSKK